MFFLNKLILKSLRKSYRYIRPSSLRPMRKWTMMPSKDYSNSLIFDMLISHSPVMIARIGSTEMYCLTNYLGVSNHKKYKNWNSYITKQTPAWWWEDSMINQMYNWSGFFPKDVEKLKQFSELMIKDMHQVDLLGSWLNDEDYFREDLSDAKKVMLEDLEPFFSKNPWTKALGGKRVLVIHPFNDTIESQYKKRTLLFENDFLPEFDLITIKAVQSVAGQETQFRDWFEALKHMQDQIDEIDFDICILGCGAYGFPLATHIKNRGKKAIHLGGVTQLLFGIKGARWENYIVYPYTNLFNEHWVRPGQDEKPKNADIVEGACYW